MKKILLLSAACLVMTTAAAQTIAATGAASLEQDLVPLSPTYLDNVFVSEPWKANWFVSAKGGICTFLGKPVGHGDLFDRRKGALDISAGKWLSPFVGTRLSFQGLGFKSSDQTTMDYQNYHADLLYNVAAHFRSAYEGMPRWDFAPFIGVGCLHNAYYDTKPFALSYGIMARYRFTQRLHLSAEIGNTTTWQDFDGIGNGNKLGDRLLQVSIGLDVTIGKIGWKKVVDPKPYILQNDILTERLERAQQDNNKLFKLHKRDEMALIEMRKILEIEGLLDKYELTMNYDIPAGNKRNNYSGLNALRARLRNKDWNGDTDNYRPQLKGDTADDGTLSDADSTALAMAPEKYFQVMRDGKVFVGAPVFFFFKIGKDELAEKAQIINIKEVANVIRKYGMCARIVGAADSQTGTAYVNERLSAKRAEYIARLMKENGVPKGRITTQFRGGISSYDPQAGNRNTCVMLYFNPQ